MTCTDPGRGARATLRGTPEDHFGEEIASRHDDASDEMFQPATIEPVVDFLAALTGNGAAVELGIGIGRIAVDAATAHRRDANDGLRISAQGANPCQQYVAQRGGEPVARVIRCGRNELLGER